MPLFPRRDWVINTRIQVDGYNACPFCNHTNLFKPASALKVDNSGQPFFEHNSLWDIIPDTNFPTYGSWYCMDNGHRFRTPAFVAKQDIYGGFTPEASGVTQAEF